MFKHHFHFLRFESKRSGIAFVGDAAFCVDHIESVWPCGVGLFRGVREIIDDGRNSQCQLDGASSLHLATFGKSFGARHCNLVPLVVFVLPGVDGVGFHDVNHVEGRLVLVAIVELIERGNLPAKRWSGITPKNKHNRFLPMKGGEGNEGMLVGGR